MTEEQRDNLLISVVQGLNNVHNTLNVVRTEFKQELISTEDRLTEKIVQSEERTTAKIKQTEDILRSEFTKGLKDTENSLRSEFTKALKDVENSLRQEIKDTENSLRQEIQDKHMENVNELAQLLRENGSYEIQERNLIKQRLDAHEKEIKQLKAKLA